MLQTPSVTMFEPKESWSTCSALDSGGLFFLLLQESSVLADLPCCVPVAHTCSPGDVPSYCFVLLLMSSEKWPRRSYSPAIHQLLPSWKARTELPLVLGVVMKWYTRNMAQISAVFSASLLIELELNRFPLPSLFSEAEAVAEMSRDNVVMSTKLTGKC